MVYSITALDRLVGSFSMQLVSLRSLVLVAVICSLLLIAHIKIDASRYHYASKLSTQPLRRALVRKVLEQDHYFVSANDPRFNVCYPVLECRTS